MLREFILVWSKQEQEDTQFYEQDGYYILSGPENEASLFALRKTLKNANFVFVVFDGRWKGDKDRKTQRQGRNTLIGENMYKLYI